MVCACTLGHILGDPQYLKVVIKLNSSNDLIDIVSYELGIFYVYRIIDYNELFFVTFNWILVLSMV